MQFKPKLYFSPGAVSLVTHIALEELGWPYELERVAIAEGQHLTDRYRRVHPLGRLPALEIEPGIILTETPALLAYVAELAPELQLLPRERLLRARANEWMSLFASAVHVAFITFFRPQRYTSDEAAAARLSLDGKQRFQEMLAYVESRLPDSGYLLGAQYSLCDAYATVFFIWARHFELPVDELPKYRQLAKQVLGRPAVQRALEQEGLGTSREKNGGST
ncbi:MAG TPA: glutathione S-transferase N-terminal domain-containing protein [Polyangiaceae bacterium]|nr:glutathione S-transferase N-terminal domain-containing protein [Polyangiaceae bacterium]